MEYKNQQVLSKARFQHALECLSSANSLIESGNYKSSSNWAYYAIFHAVRAVLAFDGIDMKRHSGIIAEFRREYIKTGIFEKELSDIISLAFDMRTYSDYDDFFTLSKEEALIQLENAKYFLAVITQYLNLINP